MALRIEVLGPLRIVGDGVTSLDRASHRRLLSILALEAPRRVGTERLIDMYWGESPPAGAKASLQTHVSALRRLIAPHLIVTEGYGYRLDLDEHRLDATEFIAIADEAKGAAAGNDWDQTLTAASTALQLWRDSPYPDLQDDLFARPEIVHLEEIRSLLMEMRSDALIRVGREADALADLERLVTEHPLRERLWELLMTARYRLGRHPEALRAFREAQDALGEVGLEPSPGLRRLEEKILLHDEELNGVRHNLPTEVTSFVGRSEQLEDVGALLAEHRVVTLTGVGGSGKTRLALRVAADALGSFPDGCWFVELADLRESDLVPLRVTTTIGLRPPSGDVLEALTHALKHETVLLVLDNCEHLLDRAADLAHRLVGSGNGVRILATSREPLHLPGEAVYDVPPLAVPLESATHEELLASEAVRLFSDRAALVDPSFRIDADNVDTVARVTRRLDGLPLAIELAAAKARAFSLEVIDERLRERFDLLAGGATAATPRHRTLEAAIAWSFDLLDDDEQRLFARLSVFRGGFDLEMVERVAGFDPLAPDTVIAPFNGLVEKSLVSRERAAPGRYRLLETVREFAGHRLEHAGEAVEARNRHLHWCIEFASSVEDRIYGTGMHELLARLHLESDNLMAGLERAASSDDRRAVSTISGVLAWHWSETGHFTRCRSALRAALESVGDDAPREAELRARLARVDFNLGDTQAALSEAVRARDIVQPLGDSVVKTAVLSRLANLHALLIDEDPRASIPLARQALAVAEAIDDPVSRVRAGSLLGWVVAWNGDSKEGLALLRDALDLALELGDPVATLDAYFSHFDPLYLDESQRRDGPRRLAEELESRFSLDDPRWARHIHLGWFPYIYLQTGEWHLAEDATQRLSRRRTEGYDRVWYLMAHGTLRWMQGRLAEAEEAMAELADTGVNPRWYHDYYPLRADIAAGRGDLPEVRGFAEEYLAVEVDTSEEAKKLGVLDPLVRAEAEAALSLSGAEREEHVARARIGVDRMQAILDDFPPPTGGSLTMETHTTHLAFARAELSRVTGPDPDLWVTAVRRADFAYFRLYGRLRLAEALRRTGRAGDAAADFASLAEQARRMGASGLTRLADALSAEDSRV